MPSHEAQLRAERAYYSDRAREKHGAVCEWHDTEPPWPLCQVCQDMYEADQENRMDAEREERGR